MSIFGVISYLKKLECHFINDDYQITDIIESLPVDENRVIVHENADALFIQPSSNNTTEKLTKGKHSLLN